MVVAAIGCCITAAVILFRALRPLRQRTDTLKMQIQMIDFEKGRRDIERITAAAQKMAEFKTVIQGD